jgi:hypothetical protein
MIIDHHNYFDKPGITKATRIVIYDNSNNPIALFMEHSDNVISCHTATDNNFKEVLDQCGITPPNIKRMSIGG